MPSQDAKLAAVLIELESKFSGLPSAVNPMTALEMLRSRQRDEMHEQYVRLLETDFHWWQRFRSPFHSIQFFFIKREHTAGAFRVSRSDWVRLKALVIRIRFGFHLDDASIRRIEYSIRENLVTERDAWRLLHSPGCRISEGEMKPAPLSSIAGSIGLSVAFFLGILAVLLLQPLVASLLGECRFPICQIVGNVYLACWSLIIGYVVVVGTWGRRDAAKLVSSILELDFVVGQAARLQIRRALFVKLFW